MPRNLNEMYVHEFGFWMRGTAILAAMQSKYLVLNFVKLGEAKNADILHDWSKFLHGRFYFC